MMILRTICLATIFQITLYVNFLKSVMNLTLPPNWSLDSRVISGTFNFVPSTFFAFN
jgi:hypothetical protein